MFPASIHVSFIHQIFQKCQALSGRVVSDSKSQSHIPFTFQPCVSYPCDHETNISIQERKKVLQASPEEKILQLTAAREKLITKKRELERKIANVEARSAAKA